MNLTDKVRQILGSGVKVPPVARNASISAWRSWSPGLYLTVGAAIAGPAAEIIWGGKWLQSSGPFSAMVKAYCSALFNSRMLPGNG